MNKNILNKVAQKEERLSQTQEQKQMGNGQRSLKRKQTRGGVKKKKIEQQHNGQHR